MCIQALIRNFRRFKRSKEEAAKKFFNIIAWRFYPKFGGTFTLTKLSYEKKTQIYDCKNFLRRKRRMQHRRRRSRIPSSTPRWRTSGRGEIEKTTVNVVIINGEIQIRYHRSCILRILWFEES
jgi:hypothetical protein